MEDELPFHRLGRAASENFSEDFRDPFGKMPTIPARGSVL
jgi:hypothetical protein